MKIDPWTVLGVKSQPGRLKNALRHSGSHVFGDFGRFWDPPKSQNGSKIAFLCIDRRLDPPKMVSGRGFGTIRKINEKMTEQMCKTHVTNVSKSIEQIHTFSNLRFLVFCKESCVKM